MTEKEEQKKPDINDFKKYQYGMLAGHLSKSREGQAYLPGALDMLASDLKLGKEAAGFIEGTYSSRHGIQKATEMYSALFEESISAYKPKDLTEWYKPILEDLDAEPKKILMDKFSVDKTLGEITADLEKSSYILNAPESMGYSEEAKVKAQETLEQYQGFSQAKSFLDNFMLENLRPEAIKKAKKRTLEAMAESWKTSN